MSKYDSLKIENQLCFPLYAVSKELIKKYKVFLDEYNLTYTQYITLMVLWENNNINVKDLGKRLFLDSGTLTPLLNKLEKKGYIKKQINSNDKRNIIVSVTDFGLNLRKKLVNVPKCMSEFLNINESEIKELYQILYKMLYNDKYDESVEKE